MTIKTRIYVDGVFDLFHYGHIELFAKIKNLFNNCDIIVGISRDDDVNKYKGISILNQDEKYRTIKHCKYVNEIILETPWIIDSEFINKYNIDYVCHDPKPYKSADKEDVYHFCKQKGIFIGINRTPFISTSEIIRRIKNLH